MARRDRTGTREHTGTPALALLARDQVAHVLHPYHHEPTSTAFGEEAVTALGLEATRVLKTLVADCGGELVVAVLAVAGQLDLKALAAVVGAKRAQLAEPRLAERTTGYVVGGISPLGQRTRLPTVVDAAAQHHRTVYVSAGRRGLQVELAPADLVRLSGARLGAISR